MPLFFAEYKILPNQSTREACMTYFAGMTKADDEKELQSVRYLVGGAPLGKQEALHAEAPDAAAMGAWLSNWIPMADIYTVPVLDDNQQRTLILGKTPEYRGGLRQGGEQRRRKGSLYFIKYKFKPEKRAEVSRPSPP